ncbi:site-specific integrase, partial [Butyricicoccus sp. 1XD8-22]
SLALFTPLSFLFYDGFFCPSNRVWGQYDKQGNKLVKNLTYSVNQSATPKQQEKEALKYAMDMEDKIKYGYDFDAEKMSFDDFGYKWLESVKDNIAYGTYTNYQHFLESKIIPYFKGFKLAHIRTPHIEAFLKTLVDDYSAGTIRGYANVLSGIFKTAKRWSMIDNNPCQDARKPKKVQEEQDIKFFTPEQSLMFLKSLNMSYVVAYKGYERVDDTGKPYHVKEYTETYTVPTQYLRNTKCFSICHCSAVLEKAKRLLCIGTI